MKHTVAIPVMGGVHELKGIVAQIEKMCSAEHELLIIDNSEELEQRAAWRTFIEKYLKPQNLKYICNAGNIGMVATLNQIHREASGEVVSILHSDVYIYEYGWDERVINTFFRYEDVGLAGFFGQRGIHWNGGREDTMSNMVEAEIHGRRSLENEYIITVDGFSIIYRKTALDEIGGFDTDYIHHHFYDKNIGLDMLNKGWKCMYIPVPVHHWSGITANNPSYQQWITNKMGGEQDGNTGDQQTFKKNMEIFNMKWGESLPITVDRNGNLSRPLFKKTDGIN